MRRMENEEVEVNEHQIYCSYCKNLILDTDETHKNRNKDYHKFCWEQLTNDFELKF